MISENQIIIEGEKIHYLEAGESTGQDVLLLHGMKFNSSTWVETGSLKMLSDKGFHAVAVDLPGFGKSPEIDMGKAETLKAVIKALDLSEPVIIAPSMSGGYSLPVIAEEKIPLKAFIAVAPTNIPDYAEALKGNPLSVLAIWGDNDEIVPPENGDLLCDVFKNAQKVIIENGGHPTYLTETDLFHGHVIKFLFGLQKR